MNIRMLPAADSIFPSKKIRVLNLYAGIGGNRILWPSLKIAVTAVELNSQIVEIYSTFFPNDKVVVADAHVFLRDHYSEFDVIWSSPPCQSHSSFRQNFHVRSHRSPADYPDMSLYQEIIFLKSNFRGLWVVENVRPYYPALINPSFILQRHFFWSNFPVQEKKFSTDLIRRARIQDLQKSHGIDLSKFRVPNKRKLLRNCVKPTIGLHIFEAMESHRDRCLSEA